MSQKIGDKRKVPDEVKGPQTRIRIAANVANLDNIYKSTIDEILTYIADTYTPPPSNKAQLTTTLDDLNEIIEVALTELHAKRKPDAEQDLASVNTIKTHIIEKYGHDIIKVLQARKSDNESNSDSDGDGDFGGGKYIRKKSSKKKKYTKKLKKHKKKTIKKRKSKKIKSKKRK